MRCGCVCLGSGLGCAPPLLAGVLGCVCVCVRAPLVPRHSWLGCAVWVCVPGLGFRLRPTTPGRGVGACVCLCAHSACTTPLLAGVCGVGVCAWARVSAAPRHSWLGCWGVCVLVCALRLYPATPGWSVRCGPSVLGLRFRLRPAFLGWGVGVCVFVCALRLYPATPGWGVRFGCVCLGSGFGCAPPLLAGVFGCVCVCVRGPLIPRHSWLGCALWACVFGLGFRLRPAFPGWAVGVCVFVCLLRLYPATPGWVLRCGCVCVGSGLGCPNTPGWGVGVCVCLFARSACTPPLLAGECSVGVCAWAQVLAAARHSWLGCWGVCVFACALLLYPATPGWGVQRGRVCFGSGFGCAPPLLAGGVGVCVPLCAHSACTPPLLAGVCGVWVWCCLAPVLVPCFVACCARCSGLRHPAAIVAWHLSVCLGCGRWRASLACLVARRGAPRLVRSGRSRCAGRLSRRRGAFPHSGGLRPQLYWVAARGTRRPAENRAHCACRWPPPRQGRWARSASYPFGGPRWGCPRHRDPENAGLPTTTKQASAILQLTTTYLDAHQLLVHPRKSVGLADTGTPNPHIRKGKPLHLEDTTVHLGVTQATRHHHITLQSKLEGRLARLPQLARGHLLSTQGLAYFMEAVLNAAIGYQALHLPQPQDSLRHARQQATRAWA